MFKILGFKYIILFMINFRVLSFLLLFFYIVLNVALGPDFLYSTDVELNLIDNHIPSVKCPTCAANSQEVWVIRGKLCHICGTACE